MQAAAHQVLAGAPTAEMRSPASRTAVYMATCPASFLQGGKARVLVKQDATLDLLSYMQAGQWSLQWYHSTWVPLMLYSLHPC